MKGEVYARVFALGFVGGLRSMMPLALIRLGARDASSLIFGAAAVGELVVDKLPVTPARTSLPGIGARVASGAFAGGAVAKEDGADVAIAVGLGIAGALAGTFGGYHARKWLTAPGRLPDFVVALAEDAVAIGLGLAVR